MCAIVSYHGCSVLSSVASIHFSMSLSTASSCATAFSHPALSTLPPNVSSFLPLYAGPFSPFILASCCEFQNTRWLTSCATEWSSFPGFQEACSAVIPSTDLLAGTNQSCSSCVDLSCASSTNLSVGAGAVWG